MSESATGGVGLFVNEKTEVSPGDVLTAYRGPPRWVAESVVSNLVGDSADYSYVLGPYVIGHGQYYILWDASSFRRSRYEAAKAHWCNTSHPELEGDWKFPSCMWGVYDRYLKLDISVQPDIHLYLVAIQHIQGVSKRELTVDYHWILAEKFGKFCGDYQCKLCFKCMGTFMERWTNMFRTGQFLVQP